jgi:hypothetical protein
LSTSACPISYNLHGNAFLKQPSIPLGLAATAAFDERHFLNMAEVVRTFWQRRPAEVATEAF